MKKRGKEVRGFTLLELVVVIIVIGILAALGFTQYARLIEKGRGAEAKQILGTLRSQAAAFYLEYNTLSAFTTAKAGIGTANDEIPSVARTSHYFYYTFAVPASNDQLTITATRSGVGGKGGGTAAAGKQLNLTTVLPTGSDTWVTDGAY